MPLNILQIAISLVLIAVVFVLVAFLVFVLVFLEEDVGVAQAEIEID